MKFGSSAVTAAHLWVNWSKSVAQLREALRCLVVVTGPSCKTTKSVPPQESVLRGVGCSKPWGLNCGRWLED